MVANVTSVLTEPLATASDSKLEVFTLQSLQLQVLASQLPWQLGQEEHELS
jgi:hypothetical protein